VKPTRNFPHHCAITPASARNSVDSRNRSRATSGVNRRCSSLNSDRLFRHHMLGDSHVRPTIAGGQAIDIWAIVFLGLGESCNSTKGER
jgi:hypothetical protein